MNVCKKNTPVSRYDIISLFNFQNSVFYVRDEALGFSVMLYSIAACIGIALFMVRRNMSLFGNAELGGPTGPKYASAFFLVGLWCTYILLASLQAYGYITAPF
jgi:solute carrier family 8 (sodium/calcium exchanger)